MVTPGAAAAKAKPVHYVVRCSTVGGPSQPFVGRARIDHQGVTIAKLVGGTAHSLPWNTIRQVTLSTSDHVTTQKGSVLALFTGALLTPGYRWGLSGGSGLVNDTVQQEVHRQGTLEIQTNGTVTWFLAVHRLQPSVIRHQLAPFLPGLG